MRCSAWMERLLVNAQHHGVLGRVEVQADDVAHLRGELRIATDLVRPNQVRLEAVLPEDIGDTAARQIQLLAQEPRRPPTAPRRGRRHRKLNDAVDGLRGHRVVLASRSRTPKPTDATGTEPGPDLGHVLGR